MSIPAVGVRALGAQPAASAETTHTKPGSEGLTIFTFASNSVVV
jgi:hypothetical protein